MPSFSPYEFTSEDENIINNINLISHIGHYLYILDRITINIELSKNNKLINRKYLNWLKILNKILCDTLSFKFVDSNYITFYELKNNKLLQDIKTLSFQKNDIVIDIYNKFIGNFTLYQDDLTIDDIQNEDVHPLFKIKSIFHNIQQFLALKDVFYFRLVNKKYLINTSFPIKLSEFNTTQFRHLDDIGFKTKMIFLIKCQWKSHNLLSLTTDGEFMNDLKLNNSLNTFYESLDIDLNYPTKIFTWKNIKRIIFRNADKYNSQIYLTENQIITLLHCSNCVLKLWNKTKTLINIELVLKYNTNINFIYDHNNL